MVSGIEFLAFFLYADKKGISRAHVMAEDQPGWGGAWTQVPYLLFSGTHF